MTTKVLIGEISSYKAIVICKYLRTHYGHLTIVTFDYRRYTKNIRTKYSDKHIVLVKKNINEYIADLAALIKQEKIDIFFPVHSSFIGQILENKHLFTNTLDYMGSYNIYQKLHDKDQLHTLARALNINQPKILKSLERASYPYVAKPISGSSAKGVCYIKKESDLGKLSKSKGRYIFQQYIKGQGCGYSLYAVNGQFETGYGHMRLAEHPIKGGSSIYRAPFYHSEMHQIAKSIMLATKWTGFVMFEFKLAPDNEIYLIEVNPRIWGSINQGLQNGFNYFEKIFGDIKTEKKRNKMKTYLSPFIYYTLFRYIANLNFKPLMGFLKNIFYNKADVRFFDDPGGWFSIVIKKL